VILNGILGALAILSFLLTLWQWLVARRFPLHQRSADLLIGAAAVNRNALDRSSALQPSVTLLKPLKGCDEHTEACLQSWLAQDYAGEVQTLFAVTDPTDPVCPVVKKLLAEFPQRDAQLIVCPERLGANAKVSKLAQLEPQVKHEIIVMSDADVRVPADLLRNAIAPLRDDRVGLVNCFYFLVNPTTLAMRWEAVAINADFWSQVLQSRSLQPLDFALGAVMVTRRAQLAEIGGFRTLVDCLADDYQLGHRIAKRGHRIELCPVVVECWSPPMNWRQVWRHQLRWARTIRVCQPLPYCFSILSNATLWPLLWLLVVHPQLIVLTHSVSGSLAVTIADFPISLVVALVFLVTRVVTAALLHRQLTRKGIGLAAPMLVPLKDLAQVAIWVGAFLGNHIEWRGERYRLRHDGTLTKE
jgi:ceramide glucosyltransferase